MKDKLFKLLLWCGQYLFVIWVWVIILYCVFVPSRQITNREILFIGLLCYFNLQMDLFRLKRKIDSNTSTTIPVVLKIQEPPPAPPTKSSPKMPLN
jgi:hypothetical protein